MVVSSLGPAPAEVGALSVSSLEVMPTPWWCGRRRTYRSLRRWWWWRWYGPTTPTGRRWLRDRSTTHNTLKARREKPIRVADHRRPVLNRVPIRAIRVRHPVAVSERNLRPHTAAGAVTDLHIGHMRVGGGVGVGRRGYKHGRGSEARGGQYISHGRIPSGGLPLVSQRIVRWAADRRPRYWQ